MQFVNQRLKQLEADLLAQPMRISVYHDLPFTLFHYPPQLEFQFREEIHRFGTRLENKSKKIITISLAELLWYAVLENDTLNNITENEKKFGFNRQSEVIQTYLSLEDFTPLPQMVLKKIKNAKPESHIVFLVRAGAMAPNLYRMSILLSELHGKTMVPIVLFYPGLKEGEAQLRYMGMEGRDAISRSNYRVKIY
ncbi:DUF1788 domain-containing protein [candidate division KSB1 bacterium]|nr:DUF1788 domain-containing protein [candidate division KSB1 bacterium]